MTSTEMAIIQSYHRVLTATAIRHRGDSIGRDMQIKADLVESMMAELGVEPEMPEHLRDFYTDIEAEMDIRMQPQGLTKTA